MRWKDKEVEEHRTRFEEELEEAKEELSYLKARFDNLFEAINSNDPDWLSDWLENRDVNIM